MQHKNLTSKIIECAYKVHNKLGYGFLESVYQNAFMLELEKSGLNAQQEYPVKVFYDDEIVGNFIADILVEEKVVLELKSVKELHPAHEVQLNNYLKATGIQVGLLINFSDSVQIKRRVFTPGRKTTYEFREIHPKP